MAEIALASRLGSPVTSPTSIASNLTIWRATQMLNLDTAQVTCSIWMPLTPSTQFGRSGPQTLKLKAQSLHLAPGGFWKLLEASGGSWGLLGPPGGFWRLLEAPGGSWGLLMAPGGF